MPRVETTGMVTVTHAHVHERTRDKNIYLHGLVITEPDQSGRRPSVVSVTAGGSSHRAGSSWRISISQATAAGRHQGTHVDLTV